MNEEIRPGKEPASAEELCALYEKVQASLGIELDCPNPEEAVETNWLIDEHTILNVKAWRESDWSDYAGASTCRIVVFRQADPNSALIVEQLNLYTFLSDDFWDLAVRYVSPRPRSGPEMWKGLLLKVPEDKLSGHLLETRQQEKLNDRIYGFAVDEKTLSNHWEGVEKLGEELCEHLPGVVPEGGSSVDPGLRLLEIMRAASIKGMEMALEEDLEDAMYLGPEVIDGQAYGSRTDNLTLEQLIGFELLLAKTTQG